MQLVMDRMIALKSETERQELKIQRLFESMLADLRGKFEQQSNLLRSDFVELQRQEQELRQASGFLKDEFAYNSVGDKGQKRLSTAQMYTAHQRVSKTIRDQRIQLTEIDSFIKAVNSEGFFSSLKLPTVAQCEQCSGGSKLATKIIAQAKVSLAKQLVETNQREAEKLGKSFPVKPRKPISAEKLIKQLAKAKEKLEPILNPKKKQT